MNLKYEFERTWPWIAASIERYGHTHDKDHIWNLLESNDAQLHPLPSAALLTNIVRHPTGLIDGNVWIGGGEIGEFRDKVEPLMVAFFKSQGCDRLTLSGRKGWAKIFSSLREVGTNYVRQL